MPETTIRRNFKDWLFRHLFNNKEDLLMLYNAINHSNYRDPSLLEITTIDDVLYMSIKNDVSFLLGTMMNLYEAQSTYNPNMPLRGMFYFSRLYSGYVKTRKLNIYSSTLLSLPAPRYIVFYNGAQEEPERISLRLSDSFVEHTDTPPCLECIATVININLGHNSELMKNCRKLYEYSYFIEKVREHLQKGISLEHAIDSSIDICIEQDILSIFLTKHREEVQQMILSEFDEEFHINWEKRISYMQGRSDSILELLSELGNIPEALRLHITKEEDVDLLKAWTKAAAQASSIQEFQSLTGL